MGTAYTKVYAFFSETDEDGNPKPLILTFHKLPFGNKEYEKWMRVPPTHDKPLGMKYTVI